MTPYQSVSGIIMSLQRTFVFEETVLRHAACFKVAMKFRSLYFIILNEVIHFARLVESFLQFLLGNEGSTFQVYMIIKIYMTTKVNK